MPDSKHDGEDLQPQTYDFVPVAEQDVVREARWLRDAGHSFPASLLEALWAEVKSDPRGRHAAGQRTIGATAETPRLDGVAQGMKTPKYAASTMQRMYDAGLNPFAVHLMAEAHADKPEKFGDETVLVVGRAHNGTPVFMLVSTRHPIKEQFKGWPPAG